MKLKEFILLLAKTEHAPSHLDFLAGMFNVAKSELQSTIANNLYSSLSIDQFAVLCNMSTSSFKRKFKETFELSPKKYFGVKKIEKAAEMLIDLNIRISDIAYDCGFESLATFNRTFKSVHGKSPSDFRLSQND